MTDHEKIETLLALCRTYEEAIDSAFVMLIHATRGVKLTPFMPSKSTIWPVLVAGQRLRDEIEASLK